MAEAVELGDLGKAQKTTRAARGESVTDTNLTIALMDRYKPYNGTNGYIQTLQPH